jgi:hypothetical protein
MKELELPDPICGAICRNSMNDRCIEKCAPEGGMKQFELREDITLPEMPAYEIRDDLLWEARFRLYEAYLKKTIDFIQGR